MPLCEDCGDRIGFLLSHEEESLSQPEERFKELFKAAEALIENDIVEDDIVYPTLVLANAIWYDLDLAASRKRLLEAWNDDIAWREEVAHFTLTHRDFKPVRVVKDVLFLELKPTIAMLRTYQTVDVPKEVGIRVHRRLKPASSKDVAAAYEGALSDAGIPYGASNSVSLDCEFRAGYLWMRVDNGREVPEDHALSVWQVREPQFPHPRLVGALYHALYGNPTEDKDGFARYLHTRITGSAPAVYNFIPACAAFFLRTDGELKWKEIFNLLNENMLRDWHPRGAVPNEREDFPKYRSRTTQLKDDVKKVGQELLRVAGVLYHPAE